MEHGYIITHRAVHVALSFWSYTVATALESTSPEKYWNQLFHLQL